MSYHSIQSVNYPDYYVRHQNFLGELSPIISSLERQDASFWVQPGLANSDGVTFQSTNFQHYYLRHQDGRIHLSHLGFFDTDDLLSKDATFMPRTGLVDGTAVSYESFNYPGSYLRHRDGHLWVEADDGSELFKLDSTFHLIASFVGGPRIEVAIQGDIDGNGGEVTVNGYGWTTGDPLTIFVFSAPEQPSPYVLARVAADDQGMFTNTAHVTCVRPGEQSAMVQIWCTDGRGAFDAKSVRAWPVWVCSDLAA